MGALDFAELLWLHACTAHFAGMLCGVTGTLLLATNGRFAGWGFVAFLASNVGWIVYAAQAGPSTLLTQHLVFAVSSLLGVYVWLVQTRDKHAADTLTMEDDIRRLFTGRNTLELARRFNISTGEVLDIALQRGPR